MTISLARAASKAFVAVDVRVDRLAGFLNAVGTALAAAHFLDVKCWMGRRLGRPESPKGGWPQGLILEVELPSPNPVATFVAAGLPIPTVWWPTTGGFKGLWAFDAPAFPDTVTAMVEEFAVAVAGANPVLADPALGHHLPIGIVSTTSGPVPLSFPATQASVEPFETRHYAPTLPLRIERVLSLGRTLSSAERQQVFAYLANVGLTAPSGPGGHAVYDRCPIQSHGALCCYVSRGDDDSPRITCIGKHGKDGRQSWGELSLYRLATGVQLPPGGLDPVASIPATWAGAELFRGRLKELPGGSPVETIVAAAVRVFWRAKANVVLEPHLTTAYVKGIALKGPPPWHKFVEFYERKLTGDVAGPCQVFFDEVRSELRLVCGTSSRPLTVKGQTLSPNAHQHEYEASAAYDLSAGLKRVKKSNEWKLVVRPSTNANAFSWWNKSLSGNPGHLAALGVPQMRVHELPVAFVEPSVDLSLSNKCIEIVRVAHTKPADASFDARGFFTDLFKAGRLPLATEADVPRLLMAIASPLLRDLAPGLLGIYWFIGPSGAGKDYLAGIVEDIWRLSVVNPVKASFDLHITDELEQKRAFATAGSAAFARAKEAGKSIEMVNMLIKLAGTDQVTARGMHRGEVQLRNTFTYMADSVEDLPERKEISRRTVMIGVGQIGDEVAKGIVRDEILRRAPDILASLKALVETQLPSWYLHQANTGSRPVVPVALAQLLGATLPQVSGGGTDELFENMAEYVKTFGADEGKAQLAAAREKDGKEMKQFPSYRLSHFAEQMSNEVGSKNFFKAYGTKRGIEMLLHREADYHTVESGKRLYLPVTIGGRRFAFKLVKAKRNFVLVEELVYCSKLGIQPISVPPPQDSEQSAGSAEPEPVASKDPAAAPTPPSSSGGPMRFRKEDLRDEAAIASNGK